MQRLHIDWWDESCKGLREAIGEGIVVNLGLLLGVALDIIGGAFVDYFEAINGAGENLERNLEEDLGDTLFDLRPLVRLCSMYFPPRVACRQLIARTSSEIQLCCTGRRGTRLVVSTGSVFFGRVSSSSTHTVRTSQNSADTRR